MGVLADVLSWVTLVTGGVFYVIGAVGLNRMPDVFTRMHAVSVGETLGVGLMIIGLLVQAGPTLVAVKLVFIVLGLWTAGAVATHALSRAALHDGEKPLLADPAGRLVPTDPVVLFPELAVRLAEPVRSEVVEEEAPEEEPGDEGAEPVGAGLSGDAEAGTDAETGADTGANPDAEPPADGGRG